MVTELHPDGVPVRVAGVVLLQATGSGQEDSNTQSRTKGLRKKLQLSECEWLVLVALFEDGGLDRREMELRVAALRSRPFRQQLHDARRIAADLPAKTR